MQNPWKALDVARSYRFGPEGVEGEVERALIDREYEQASESEPCGFPGCPEIAHYRPTVGAVMCANRHGLALNGSWRAL